jgi:hypothetical protein
MFKVKVKFKVKVTYILVIIVHFGSFGEIEVSP